MNLNVLKSLSWKIEIVIYVKSIMYMHKKVKLLNAQLWSKTHDLEYL